MTAKPSPGWSTLCTFADGSTVQERGLPGDAPGVETRIFTQTGRLKPLPDGRTSPADHDPDIPKA